MIGPDELDESAAEFALGTLDAESRAELDARRLSDPRVDAAIGDWERLLAPLAVNVPEVEPPAALFAQIERRLSDRRRFGARRVVATALALAACLVLALGLLFELRSPSPRFEAQLRRNGGDVAFTLDVSGDGRALTARPVAVAEQPGKSFELWVIPNGARPVAVGLLDPRAVAQFSLADSARVENATWAVTVEPPGGSPSGNPTGPIVFSGRFVKS
jgi:anti-sigma-K factor RskA